MIFINSDPVRCAGMPVRVVVGSEPDATNVNAGARLQTSASCWITRSVEAPIERRWVVGDDWIPRRGDTVSVGVDLAVAVRPVLYWVTVSADDRGDPSFKTEAFVQGRSGAFNTALKRMRPGVWRFPDQYGDPQMSDIGIQVSSWSFQPSGRPGGKRHWKVDLSLRVQVFSRQ